MNSLWAELAARAEITLTDEHDAKLSRYLQLLFEANEKINLTRITDLATAEVQHVGDSLTLLPYLPTKALKLADVGSGGGVPGIPLAIVRPDVKVTLIEATKKKAAFLRHAVEQLELKNVTVLDSRAEDVGRGPKRETFDVAVARAVATMVWLAEWCLPLVKRKGRALAMKGPKAAEELPAALRAIRLLGGGPPVTLRVELPGTEQRVIIEMPKFGTTPPAFPRSSTEAKGKSMDEFRR